MDKTAPGTPPARPDPDALVLQLRREDERARRGKLRIYFGANAGVGKTFAMLNAAQRETRAGRDVVVGVAETHGRAETAELTRGLEQLALRQVPYRGRALPEFDLDGALSRRPAVLVVDELAHSNVPGSRHEKRWQDVQELRDAGIDVWTALNVQHLESLNGTVGAITGVRVQETVPDTVFDSADELVLIDVTPDELVSRLKAGKVYLPQQAERAAQNFFRKGNLIALREIALRRTAERVGDDRIHWRVETPQTGGTAAAGSDAVLCCVGPQAGAEQAVRAAARLAGQRNQRWAAVYVETPRLQRLPPRQRDRTLAVLRLAADLGAETAVLTGPDVAQALAQHALRQGFGTLVTGRAAQHAGVRGLWSRLSGDSLRMRLGRLAAGLDLLEVGAVDSTRRIGPVLPAEELPQERRRRWPGYACAALGSVGLTVALQELGGAFELANIVMLYQVAVVLVALRFGRGPAAVAALLNVLAFDFFFVPPRLSFSVSDVQYLVTFAVMLGVGLLIGQLTAGLKFQARIARDRESRSQSLFELSRELSAALLPGQIASLGEAAVHRNFGGQAHVLVADEADMLPLARDLPPGVDASVADWVYRNGQPAGLATPTLSAHAWHYVPLTAPMRIRGVLACRPEHARWLLIPGQQQLLETLAHQVAIALERVHYVDVARKAVVQMESERLRNTLLATMSHDIRTPLTALVGQAETLRAGISTMATENRDRLLAGLETTARQMQGLVINLLDMARLQSGAVQPRSDWQSVEELVGAALRAAAPALGGIPVLTDVPGDLPLVEFDATLMERVLVNLLENAAKYAAPPIEIRARALPQTLEISVRDHGAGLPAGEAEDLFGMFTRGEAESRTPGVGLGLAICREVVAAHAGRIAAGDAVGGGAEFTILLPRRPAPAMEEEGDG
jgi:two-component system sensor histidine kinase KdpD